jgi:hypothetical protein
MDLHHEWSAGCCLLSVDTTYHNFLQDTSRQQEHNVLILVDFAIALMTILDQINRESFQRFKLRIGEEILYCSYRPVLDSQLHTVPSGNHKFKNFILISPCILDINITYTNEMHLFIQKNTK